MAQYKVTCEKCGKAHIMELFGKHKQREYILSQYSRCSDFGRDCQAEISDARLDE